MALRLLLVDLREREADVDQHPVAGAGAAVGVLVEEPDVDRPPHPGDVDRASRLGSSTTSTIWPGMARHTVVPPSTRVDLSCRVTLHPDRESANRAVRPLTRPGQLPHPGSRTARRPNPPDCRSACTAAITDRLPVRPSLMPPRPSPEVSTQRIFPARTASASQLAVTSLSLPEKPPIAATSAPSMTWRAGARLGGDGDRAAAVRAGVGERLGERGAVAAEHPAARPGRRAPRRAARRAKPPRGRRHPPRAAAAHPGGLRAAGRERPARGVAERLRRPCGGRDQQRAERRRRARSPAGAGTRAPRRRAIAGARPARPAATRASPGCRAGSSTSAPTPAEHGERPEHAGDASRPRRAARRPRRPARR